MGANRVLAYVFLAPVLAIVWAILPQSLKFFIGLLFFSFYGYWGVVLTYDYILTKKYEKTLSENKQLIRLQQKCRIELGAHLMTFVDALKEDKIQLDNGNIIYIDYSAYYGKDFYSKKHYSVFKPGYFKPFPKLKGIACAWNGDYSMRHTPFKEDWGKAFDPVDLEYLYMPRNDVRSVPENILEFLPNLKYLIISYNPIEELPEEIMELPLRYLDLGYTYLFGEHSYKRAKLKNEKEIQVFYDWYFTDKRNEMEFREFLAQRTHEKSTHLVLHRRIEKISLEDCEWLMEKNVRSPGEFGPDPKEIKKILAELNIT